MFFCSFMLIFDSLSQHLCVLYKCHMEYWDWICLISNDFCRQNKWKGIENLKENRKTRHGWARDLINLDQKARGLILSSWFLLSQLRISLSPWPFLSVRWHNYSIFSHNVPVLLAGSIAATRRTHIPAM